MPEQLAKIINALSKQYMTLGEQYGDKAALIKIVSPEKGFHFDGGSLGIVGTEQKKKLECEIADKNRQNKIEDYRKSLEDTLAMKSLERKKLKEEEDKYRKSLEEEYALYLKEEEQKKMKKFEQYESYRKALEEQRYPVI